MHFTTSRPLTLDNILNADLNRYPIAIIRGVGPKPSAYLCAQGAALRVQLAPSGHCIFSVPVDGQMPWLVFSALEHAFDCTFERVCNEFGRRLATAKHRQAVMKDLDGMSLEPSERILYYALDCSDSLDPDPAIAERVSIARELTGKNPALANEENAAILLLLTEDIYLRRHRPFELFLCNKDEEAAEMAAEAMLVWARS